MRGVGLLAMKCSAFLTSLLLLSASADPMRTEVNSPVVKDAALKTEFVVCGGGLAGVCAAVSALAFTLLNCLKDEEAQGTVKLKREIVRDGYFCVEAHALGGSDEKTEIIFNTVLTGLYAVADEYPEYVKTE